MTLLQLAAVPLLVFLNGFFVAAEFALVKIRDTQLETLVANGHSRAKVARRIVRNLDAALSSTQLGITLASLGLGWVGKPVFATLLMPMLKYLNVDATQADWIGFGVGFTIITFLHIVAGELAPKSLAIQKPLATSLWIATPLHWFYVAFYPCIWALNHAAFWLLRRFGLQPVTESELTHSEEEIRLLLTQTRRHTSGPNLGQDIALNAFALRQRRVGEIMRPRHEIVGLNTADSLEQCLAVARRTRYSRFPLCQGGDLDKTLGVVTSKDLMDLRPEAKCACDLARVARKIIFVPESAQLEKVLCLFLQRKLHLALVVNEYGSTIGLVTLENVLEELVGPIEDEFDQEQPLVRRIEEDSWEIDGALPTHKLGELVGEHFDDTACARTVSGFVMQRLGRFPATGDSVSIGAWQLQVGELIGTRIAKLKLTRPVDPGGGLMIGAGGRAQLDSRLKAETAKQGVPVSTST